MWEMLYEEFWDKLEHFCYRLCRDEGRAEDMAQEVFLRALQNRALVESFTPGQCRAWLFAAARNLYCDQVRRAVREQELLEWLRPDPEAEPPDETAAAALERVDLDSLLALLAPADRELFELRYRQGWNATQLGQRLGLSPATVRTRLARIRAELQKDLKED